MADKGSRARRRQAQGDRLTRVIGAKRASMSSTFSAAVHATTRFETATSSCGPSAAIKTDLAAEHWDECSNGRLSIPARRRLRCEHFGTASRRRAWFELAQAWEHSHGYSTAQADFADTADDPKNVIPDGPLDRMVARFIWCGEVERYYDTETHKFITALSLNAICTDVAAYGTSGTNTAAAQFQNHPKVRKADIVTFRPAQPLIIKEGSATALNTWRPSRYVPAKNVANADVQLWLDHIELIFGPLAEPAANHVLDWMAFVIQRPGEKINHALVIYGETQGTGKDSAFTPFFRTIGVPHNVPFITPERLRGQWTDYLEAPVICVEEMMNFNRGEMANKLKPLLAAPPILRRRHFNRSNRSALLGVQMPLGEPAGASLLHAAS